MLFILLYVFFVLTLFCICLTHFSQLPVVLRFSTSFLFDFNEFPHLLLPPPTVTSSIQSECWMEQLETASQIWRQHKLFQYLVCAFHCFWQLSVCVCLYFVYFRHGIFVFLLSDNLAVPMTIIHFLCQFLLGRQIVFLSSYYIYRNECIHTYTILLLFLDIIL